MSCRKQTKYSVKENEFASRINLSNQKTWKIQFFCKKLVVRNQDLRLQKKRNCRPELGLTWETGILEKMKNKLINRKLIWILHLCNHDNVSHPLEEWKELFLLVSSSIAVSFFPEAVWHIHHKEHPDVF